MQIKFDKVSYSKSSSTTDSTQSSFIGPGAYNIKYDYTERNHYGPTFTKSPKKPRQISPSPEIPIDPDYNVNKKSIPGFKIVPESEKNEKQKLRDEIESFREEKAALIWKLANPDKPYEVHGGIILPESTAPHRPENTKLGPGRYEISYK